VDVNAIEALREAGADLTEGRELRVFLHFPSEDEARSAATKMPSAGFRPEVTEEPSASMRWLVTGRAASFVVNEASIAELRATLDNIARMHDGDFDRWESERSYLG
jgi:hypothetical protein